MLDVNIINPFLESTISTTEMVSQLKLEVGKPYARTKLSFDGGSVLIIIGVTGAMKGQVVMGIPEAHAKEISSKMMMGMPVEELDEMALSAISELGNMIMGNAATIFSTKEILIDITPPILQRGAVKMENFNSQIVSVPLISNGENYIEINILIKQQN